MRDVTNFYRGATSRLNILYSLLLVVFAFAACSGQSKLMSLTPSASASAAPVTTSAPGVQASYADLVSRVAPAVVTIRSTAVPQGDVPLRCEGHPGQRVGD